MLTVGQELNGDSREQEMLNFQTRHNVEIHLNTIDFQLKTQKYYVSRVRITHPSIRVISLRLSDTLYLIKHKIMTHLKKLMKINKNEENLRER